MIHILHQNCDSELANDKSLPYTAYLVKYIDEESICCDIVISDKKADIFDYYWDLYRENLINLKQTEGRVNPRLWPTHVPQTKKIR